MGWFTGRTSTACRLTFPLVAVATLGFMTGIGDAAAANLEVPCGGGDAAPLVAAMLASNANPDADTLLLAEGCTYTLTAGELPVTGETHIIGHGAVIDRVVNGVPFRLFNVMPGAQLEIVGLTLSKGFRNTGGAIRNAGTLVVKRSTLSDNSYGNGCDGDDEDGCFLGGAIYNAGTGTATIRYSTLLRNASPGGGAIANRGTMTVKASSFTGNSSFGYAGAIWSTGNLTVDASTFSQNGADMASGILSQGTLAVTNSTFSGGAGAAIVAGGQATITHATIVDNARETTPSDNVGGIFSLGGSVTVTNSIVAHSRGENAWNCLGTIVDGGGNMSSDGTCAGFIVGDVRVGPLQDNGGPTPTHALLTESSGNDLVAAANCPLGVDQRGVRRPQNVNCDIGAYETKLTGYRFDGFYLPIENEPARNWVKAGRTVRLSFSLTTRQGRNIFVPGSPGSRPVQCGTTAIVPIGDTEPNRGHALSYDRKANEYTYVWPTRRAWGGTCRQLVMRLDDGSDYTAVFVFR